MGTPPPGALDRARKRRGGSKIVSIEVDHNGTAAEFEKRAADVLQEAMDAGGPERRPALANVGAGYAQLALSHRVAQLVDVLSPDVEVVERKP
jgi:hypothetical protein